MGLRLYACNRNTVCNGNKSYEFFARLFIRDSSVIVLEINRSKKKLTLRSPFFSGLYLDKR